MGQEANQKFRSGLIFGLIAYIWWGLVPLYFSALKQVDVPAQEVLAHRILWSLPVLVLLTAITSGWSDLFRVLANRKLVLILLASALFLAINWLIYIYATETNRVAEASLGYYMLPLVNAALATLFLGERLRPLHYPALALVLLGVCIPFFASGKITWIAIMLPITFGIYGVIRKQVKVESMTGLMVESLLMFPPSACYLIWLTINGSNHFAGNWSVNALIALSGVVTVVPLLTFTLSIRRLSLLTVSFIQFISPTVQMLLAICLLGETVTPDRIAAFACIWLAVAVFIFDAVRQSRSKSIRSYTYSQETFDGELCPAIRGSLKAASTLTR